jgi:hypothetical protein
LAVGAFSPETFASVCTPAAQAVAISTVSTADVGSARSVFRFAIASDYTRRRVVRMDVLSTVLGFALGIWVPHVLVAWDERRLDSVRQRRGWNTASHWAAVLAFSFLSVPVHFARTRRTVRGFALGLGLACAGLLLTALALEILVAVWS